MTIHEFKDKASTSMDQISHVLSEEKDISW